MTRETITGTQLKERRERLGLTQGRLAELLTTTLPTVGRWERGQLTIAHPGMVDLALRALESQAAFHEDNLAREMLARGEPVDWTLIRQQIGLGLYDTFAPA